jgi:hypothetical protein|tara:strand:- start:39 stop:290 length:252 start_codon:yes stop_codon:yes gene_type:complete
MPKHNKIKEDLVRFKNYKVRTDIPEDLQIVIQTFIEATIMVGENKLEFMPGEYLANLMMTLDKYPEYSDTLVDIIRDSGLDEK